MAREVAIAGGGDVLKLQHALSNWTCASNTAVRAEMYWHWKPRGTDGVLQAWKNSNFLNVLEEAQCITSDLCMEIKILSTTSLKIKIYSSCYNHIVYVTIPAYRLHVFFHYLSAR